jgi:hypothetical protein
LLARQAQRPAYYGSAPGGGGLATAGSAQSCTQRVQQAACGHVSTPGPRAHAAPAHSSSGAPAADCGPGKPPATPVAQKPLVASPVKMPYWATANHQLVALSAVPSASVALLDAERRRPPKVPPRAPAKETVSGE